MPGAKYFQPEKLSSRISLIRVPVPNGRSVKFSNCYVIGNKRGFFLVDSGWLDEFNSLNFKRALDSVGYSIQNLNGIIVTHYHQDHLGLALDLKSDN
ncbi:MAG: MBL fold metallo-hydrolase, partial [Candidatus Thermoplasmatota archaeon]|nr:MBL fold metallo-hydrolase [Candidatus Thermoplasmatota archaeon]